MTRELRTAQFAKIISLAPELFGIADWLTGRFNPSQKDKSVGS